MTTLIFPFRLGSWAESIPQCNSLFASFLVNTINFHAAQPTMCSFFVHISRSGLGSEPHPASTCNRKPRRRQPVPPWSVKLCVCELMCVCAGKLFIASSTKPSKRVSEMLLARFCRLLLTAGVERFSDEPVEPPVAAPGKS